MRRPTCRVEGRVICPCLGENILICKAVVSTCFRILKYEFDWFIYIIILASVCTNSVSKISRVGWQWHLLHTDLYSFSDSHASATSPILETKLIFQIPLATEQKIGRKSAGITDACFSLRVGRVKIRHRGKEQMSPPPPPKKKKKLKDTPILFKPRCGGLVQTYIWRLPSLKLTCPPGN